MTKLLFTASRASHITQFHMPYINYYISKGFKVYTAAQGNIEIPNVVHKNLIFEKQNLIKNISSIFELKKFIKDESIDIVISNATLAGIITRFSVFLLFKKPTVIHSCHGYLFSKNTNFLKKSCFVFVEKFFAPITKLAVTMNEEDYNLAKKYKFSKNIINIPGIGFCKKNSKTEEFKDLLKENSLLRNFIDCKNVFLIVYIAELSKRKNQTKLIELIAPLLKKHENWRVVLAGNGVLKDELNEQIKNLSLQDKICLPGFISDVEGLLAFANIAVSTSKSEGLPFNILEAMTAGVPVLASKIKGHSDLIEDGNNGFLFSLNDSAEFTEKIEQFETNQLLRQKVIQNAKKSVKSYELENVFNQILDAYALADLRLKRI